MNHKLNQTSLIRYQFEERKRIQCAKLKCTMVKLQKHIHLAHGSVGNRMVVVVARQLTFTSSPAHVARPAGALQLMSLDTAPRIPISRISDNSSHLGLSTDDWPTQHPTHNPENRTPRAVFSRSRGTRPS